MKSTRRRFLKTTAAAAAFSIVPRHVLGGPNFVAPSGKINVAIVGVGGQGIVNLRGLMQHPDVQVIAIADPMESVSLEEFYYKGLGGRGPTKAEIEKHYAARTPNFKCAAYADFRTMLEREKAIDAVLVATPDHLHAYVSVAAMKAGKHVYCEKPLTHNLAEARRVAEVARETGVATQMGNLGHSTDGIRQTCEWIWDGAIGPVRQVHAWVGMGRWNPGLIGRPTDASPVPAGLDWDLWLGPREPRPYSPAYVPVKWRDFWAFGASNLGDFGCHDMDAACWALDLQTPLTVEACTTGPMTEDIAGHGSTVYYEFGSRGSKPPVRLTWYDGGLRPERPAELPEDVEFPSRGVLFVGEKGSMLCGGAGGKPQLLPESLMDGYKAPAPSIPRSKGHQRDWLDAIKGGPPASSNFEYGARLTELVLVGVLATRLGKTIRWDPAKMEARGVPEAQALIRGTYRKGWEVG